MKHSIRLTALGILWILLVVTFARPRAEAQQDEATGFNFAFNLYQDGRYDLALVEFDKFLRDFPRSVKLPDALLYKGIAQQQLGRTADAINTLELLLAQYSHSQVVDKALYAVGQAYFAENQYQEAQEALNRLTSEYRDSPYLLPGIALIGDLLMFKKDFSAAIQC